MSDAAPDPHTIFIGIDDTDIVGSPGTNQLARAIVKDLAERADLLRITRHQLLDDPRVPCTSQNGSASILLSPRTEIGLDEVFEICRERMRVWYVVGSDPGLSVCDHVPDEVVAWGQRCKNELVSKSEAFDLAQSLGIRIEGLGGTDGGVIGALAALGLAREGDDGRIVMWQLWPDDLSGPTSISRVRERQIDVVERESGTPVLEGIVNVGKHLRPNLVAGRATLWVTGSLETGWQALKLR